MSFYGKIFSEMGEVFSLFHFKNTDGKTTTNFISEEERLKNFDLGAESFNDKLIMKAGNSWIQFKQIKNPLPNETGEAVEIYHSQPMKGAASDGGSRLVISDIIFDDNEQYNKLISGDSDLLTQEEKEALMEARANNLLFFGDTINIQSPQFDKAGHITGYKTETYKISEIPRLEEFLDMSNDVIELQEIVGVTGYPETSAKGTLGQRVKALEDDFESAKDSADNADEASKNATEKANQAAADAEAAAKALLEKGVHRVFISMGAEGVYAADEHGQLWLQNLPGKMVNTTGCGDAFMAALVWAYLEDMDLRQTALAGLAAGAIAMEYDATINPAMSADALRARMKK